MMRWSDSAWSGWTRVETANCCCGCRWRSQTGDPRLDSLRQSPLRLALDPQDLLERHLIHRERHGQSEQTEWSRCIFIFLRGRFKKLLRLWYCLIMFGRILRTLDSRTPGALSKDQSGAMAGFTHRNTPTGLCEKLSAALFISH